MAHRLSNRLIGRLSRRSMLPRMAASSTKQDFFLPAASRSDIKTPCLPTNTNQRFFSSFNNGSAGLQSNPSYQVYGEEVAFTVKCIMPTFRLVGNRTVVIDNKNKGRLLLEFTPRQAEDTNRFAWDQSIKFALSAEEVGTLVAHLQHGQPLELARQTAAGGNQQYGFHDNDTPGVGSLQKILRATPNGGAAVTLSIDYELDGRSGQEPPNPNEANGPLEIRLMTGESQVLKSIMEHSIPRLVGWAQMMDQPAKDLVSSQSNNNRSSPSPHSYNKIADGGNYNVPF